MTASPDASLAAAWDLWRESSCLERGGHFWARRRKAAAEASARTAERQRYRGIRQWLRVYECDLCHGWHLTSKPGGRRQPGPRKRAA